MKRLVCGVWSMSLAFALLTGCSGGAMVFLPDASESDAPTNTDGLDEDLGPDLSPDIDEDTAAPDSVNTSADEIDGEGVSVEVVTFYFDTASGPAGESLSEVSLGPDDEPAAYLATPGYQMDIVVSASDLDAGTEVGLLVAGSQVGIATFATYDGPGVQARFSAVNLTHDADGYVVGVITTDREGNDIVVSKTVRVNIGTCGVALLPANTACLLVDTNTAVAGVQTAFTVSNPDRTCDRAQVDVSIGGRVVSSGPLALGEAKSATVELTLFEGDGPINDAPITVTATVSDSTADGRSASLADIAFVMDLSDPIIAFTAPTKEVLNRMDDQDGDIANGITFDVEGSASGIAPSSTITFRIDDTVIESAAPDGTGLFRFEDVSLRADGRYQLVATGRDQCGREGTAQFGVTAHVSEANYVFLTPTQDGTLYAHDDLDPLTPMVFDLHFSILASAVQVGSTLSVRCRADRLGAPEITAARWQVTALEQDDIYEIPGTLDVTVLSSHVVCYVMDDAENPTTSGEVTFRVALPAPRLVIVQPVENGVVTQSPMRVRVSETHLDGITPTVVIRSGDTPVVTHLASPFGIGGSTFDLPLESGGVPIPDGLYTLVVEVTDALGNRASDIPGNVTHVTFTKDTLPPSVVITNPVADSLPPPVDEDTATAGFQATFVVTVASGGGDGTLVCLTLHGSEHCSTLTNGATTATFAGLTLIPGINVATARAVDLAGNVGIAPTRSINLALANPRVLIATPARDGPVAALPMSLVVHVSDASGTVPAVGASVTLRKNGTVLGSSQVTNASGDAMFAISALSATGDVFVASSGAGVSSPRTLWHKTALPTLAFATPQNGASANLADPACAPGIRDCVLDVTLSATNIEDGSRGDLTVACGTTTTNFVAFVADDQLVFPAVTLLHGTTCTLTVIATDLAGTPTTAGPVTVRVDRVAPVIAAFIRPAANVDALTDMWDEDVTEDGLQYTMTIRIGGAEAGQALTVAYGPVGEASQTVSAILAATIPDSGRVDVSLPEASLHNGTNLLTVTLSDAAGNTVSTFRSILVWAGAPVVRIMSPAHVAPTVCAAPSACAAGGYCHLGNCAIPWSSTTSRNLLVSLVQVPDSLNNLRICSDQAGLGTTACSTAGFREVARVTAPSEGFQTVSLTTLADGLHTLIAEARVSDAEPWVSSRASPDAAERQRNVFQDTLPPQLTRFVAASDTLPPQNTLNLLEQAEAGRVFAFEVTASEPGRLVLFVNGPEATAVADFTGMATVQATLNEGGNLVQAQARDQVGNLGTPMSLNLAVDTTPPTLAFVQPIKTLVTAVDSQDVVIASDAVGQFLTLSERIAEEWVDQATVPIDSSQRATFSFETYPILTDGDHQIRARVLDAAGNESTLVRDVAVDRVFPSLTVTAPMDGASLFDADDASPSDGGYQVLVQFSCSSTDGVAWAILMEGGCDETFATCNAPIRVAAGSLTPGVTIERRPTLSLGNTRYYRLTVQVFDQAGNMTAAVRTLTVDLAQCWLSLGGILPGGFVNNDACPTPGNDCEQVPVTVTTALTPGCTSIDAVTLFMGGIEVQTQVPSGPTVTFSAMNLTDETATTIEVRAYGGATEQGSTGVMPLVVDLTDPVISVTAPETGEVRRWGLTTDLFMGDAGLQVDLTVGATDSHLDGGQLESLNYDTGSGPEALPLADPILPFSFGSAPVTLQTVTLPDQTSGHLAVTVSDAAGNITTSGFDVMVDILAPSALVLDAVDPSEVNRRRPTVILRWRAVGDNDEQSGTQAAAYDIRYSRYPITAGNFEAACPVAELANTAPIPLPSLQGTAEVMAVTGPDPRDASDPCRFVMGIDPDGAYHFAARVIDDVGNASLVTTDSIQTADVGLRVATISGSAGWTDSSSDLQKRVYGIGDVDGDGFADVGLGGGSLAGFCVVYGFAENSESGLDVVLSDPIGPHHACQAGTTGSQFGTPLVALGDVNGDGVDDLGVGEGFGTGHPYRVSVFLGRTGQALADAPNVVITGMNNVVAGVKLAGGGDFDGDGRPDILIGSRGENRAYLVPGDLAWNAETSLAIDLADADDHTAHRIVTFVLSDPVTEPPELATNFGINVAFVRDLAPDVLDGRDEVVIATDTNPNQVVMLRGRAVPAAMIIAISRTNDGSGEDSTAVRLFPDTTTRLFGSTSLDGSADLDADGRGDLLIGHYNASPNKTVYAFYGTWLKGRFGQAARLEATAATGDGTVWAHGAEPRGWAVTGTFDRPIVVSNLDNDPALIASDDIAYVHHSGSAYGKVYVRLNLADPTDGYGHFPYAAPVLVDPNEPEGTRMGSFSAVHARDFNRDGHPDLAVGTNGAGYVLLMY